VQDQRISTILWRGKWLIAAAVIVGALGAVLITKSSSKVYAASVVIQVNAAATSAGNQSPADVQAANQVLAQTYATLIGDRSLLQAIRPSVEKGAFTTTELQSRVSASAVTNTALVDMSAQGPSTSAAQDLANGVANAFVTYIQTGARSSSDSEQGKLRQQMSAVSRQIAGLERGAQNATKTEQLNSLRDARTALQAQLANLIASSIEQGGSVRVVAPATGSSAPISPRPTLDLLAGILLGLLVGVAIAWLRVRLDRGLHGSAEVEELLGAPVLATVPVRKTFALDDPVLGEAYDILRANLAFLSHDRAMQVLTVSSFNPREGKSSTVEGLAFAAARGGISVCVVDGDVRTRTLTERLGLADAPGLTNVVVGAAEIDDVLAEVAKGVVLLPAGPAPPNPPSLLSSVRMSEVIDDLRGRFSLVLIDAPPVNHLADAPILASQSDGILFVAWIGSTARADLITGASTLRHSPTPIVGAVVLERRTVDETYYPAIAGAVHPGSEPEREREPAETI
jgi:capsular exopolysaccharide synthesis family protein